MGKTMTIKQSLIDEMNKRVEDKILERTNADLLIKLITQADSDNEAMMIAELGTTYKRTGLHFDKRLEKMTSNIRYFKKNNELSFHTDDSKPTHKLIIGDNYEALQNLLIQYKGKIDVIYIDPPYGKDNMGEFAKTNYDNAITRDNLLSMLYPRLQLAKQLLSNEGVIFCSIDDRNQAYVKCLFDEVFEGRSFVGTYFWKKTDTPPALSTKIRKKYEYILCYGKQLDKSYKFTQGNTDGGDIPLLNNGNQIKEVCFPKGSVHFNIPDGTYQPSNDKKVQLCESVVVKNGLNENAFNAKGRWKWKQDTLNEEVENGTYFLVKSEKFSFRFQRNGAEKTIKVPQNNIDSELGVGTNEEGSSELEKILGKKIFDNPKPSSLISFLTEMTNKDEDAVILDFFAGSGTTGHAVLDLNQKDGGIRQFILCQLNEATEENPNGIAYDVTSKRLKRIMTGACYDGNKDFPWLKDNEPYGGNLDVYEIVSVVNNEYHEKKSPFEVIDETLYGREKFKTLKDKVDWVCQNFNNAQKIVENDADWQKRTGEK